jgi:SAM-dependent methyltransferase
MTVDEAIRQLRRDPAWANLVRDAYLGRDIADSVDRFVASAEWEEVRLLLSGRLQDAVILDLGAGTGIASAAFRGAGAGRVIALEPDPSDEVGRGAMARGHVAAEILDASGEDIPLLDASVDVAYARQVLHHARDLDRMVSEVARVLRPGGIFLACREHVVDDERQLQAFLGSHPVHLLAGGENAYPLDRYVLAIDRADLVLLTTLGPWDSIINAFPAVRSTQELHRLPVDRLRQRFGPLGSLAGRLSAIRNMEWSRIDRRDPGRLYSFLAVKP